MLPSRPRPSLTQPLNQVDQRYQHRNLDERPNRGRQGLFAIRTKSCNGHGYCQLEVITRGREALHATEAVAEAQPAADPERDEEDDDKVDEQRSGDSDHRHDLPYHVASLRGEEHDDCVEQADEGPGRDESQENALVPLQPGYLAEKQPGDDGCPQRNAQKHGDTRGYGRVGSPALEPIAVISADDVDEEDCERGKENHLEHRVYGDEDGAVVAVAACQGVPDEYHGYASSEAYQDQAGAQAGLVGEESPSQTKLEK
ncbi:hypothetical protein S40288_11570, partial [Stachybotrys chartarum IBT 40288]